MVIEEYSDLLRQVIAGNDLSREQTYCVFTQIMDGQLSDAQIAGILVALSAKGETIEEIAGAAEAMREHSVKIDAGGMDVLDTCGTGGTGLKTFNVSTTAAMVLAGAGAKVAKHGNRTNTRSSGSADVLVALGVNLDADPDTIARCLVEAGVCFCFAVRCHPAMKYAVPVRKSLAVRTIFNVLGPLTNPAGAKRQVMGVFDAALTEKIARVLGMLGATRAMTLHAADGLDEISITSETNICEYIDGDVKNYTVKPEDFGMERASMDELLVGSPDESAEVVTSVLDGKKGPARDIVLLNAAAGFVVSEMAADLAAGIVMAAESVDSGAAKKALDTLVMVSNS